MKVLVIGPKSAARVKAPGEVVNHLAYEAEARDPLTQEEWFLDSEARIWAFRGDDGVLTEFAENAVSLVETGVWYVNVIDVSREYGGPEEGGWWWDNHRVRFSIPVAEANVDAVKKTMEDDFGDDDDGRSLSSVLSSGQTRVTVTEWPAESTEPPHYE
jgi:hypothetical protein